LIVSATVRNTGLVPASPVNDSRADAPVKFRTQVATLFSFFTNV